MLDDQLHRIPATVIVRHQAIDDALTRRWRDLVPAAEVDRRERSAASGDTQGLDASTAGLIARLR